MTTLLVALQMNDADEAALAWARWLHARGGISKVVLLGLDDPVALEDELAALLPELLEEAPPVASLLDYLESQRRAWPDAGSLLETELRRGTAWKEVVTASRDLGADIVLVPRSLGADPVEGGLSASARRVVRKAPCDVLCVRGPAPTSDAHVLVPSDFSTRSDAALSAALRMAGDSGKVTMLSIYRVPRGAATKPADLEQVGARLEEGLLAKLAEQATRFGGGDRVTTIVRQKPGRHETVVNEIAALQHADLVCIGSRGRTAMAQIALGSVAEGVLDASERAVFVHKEKGETMGLLEALGF